MISKKRKTFFLFRGQMQRHQCQACHVGHTQIDNRTGLKHSFCKQCQCKAPKCALRAIFENGMCKTHEQAKPRTCRLCSKPSTAQYCHLCYPKVPQCKGQDCTRKVILTEDSTFFDYCKSCKCETFPCQNERYASGYCEDCEQNSVCQRCKGPKSTRHNNPLCRRCQQPDCKALCGQKTGFEDEGCTIVIPYCKDCRCKTTNCKAQCMPKYGLCEGCYAQAVKVNFCPADFCGKPIAKGKEYCVECNVAYAKQQDRCPTPNCNSYKFAKKPMCALCYLAMQKTVPAATE